MRTGGHKALALLNVSATQELAHKTALLKTQSTVLQQQSHSQNTRLDQQQASPQTRQTQMARLLGETTPPLEAQARKQRPAAEQ